MILDKNDRGKILPEHSGMISVRYDKGRLEGQGNFLHDKRKISLSKREDVLYNKTEGLKTAALFSASCVMRCSCRWCFQICSLSICFCR